MREIKKYVNDIFKNITMNEDLTLQKSELYDHLVDKVNDLVASGIDTEKAIMTVKINLGDVNEVRKELHLVPDVDQIIIKLKKINFISYLGVILSLIGIELFFVIRYFFKDGLSGFLFLILCVTASLSVLSYVIYYLNTINKDTDQHQTLLKSIRKKNISIVIINPISLALCLPLLKQEVMLGSYLKEVFVYLILAYLLIHVGLNYIVKMMSSKGNPKSTLFTQYNYWVKYLFIRYFYIPILLSLFLILATGSNTLIYTLIFVCITIQMIYDIIQSRNAQTWPNLHFLRAFLIGMTLTSLAITFIDYYNPSLNLRSIEVFILLFLLAMLFVLTIISIIRNLRNLKNIPFDKFIKQMGLLISVIAFTITMGLILSTQSVSMYVDRISYSLNTIIAKKVIVFYFIVEFFIKLTTMFLIRHYQISQKDPSNRNISLMKKRYVLLVMIGYTLLIFTLKLPERLFYEYNVQTNFKNTRVDHFNYQVYKVDNNDTFILSSFDLSNGSSCIAYQQYFSMIKPGVLNLFPHQLNYKCDQSQYTISATHSVVMDLHDDTKKTHDIQLYVFGSNTGAYKDVVITYKWGEVIRIPINNDTIFFHYQEIEVPNHISMDEVWGSDFFTLTKE